MGISGKDYSSRHALRPAAAQGTVGHVGFAGWAPRVPQWRHLLPAQAPPLPADSRAEEGLARGPPGSAPAPARPEKEEPEEERRHQHEQCRQWRGPPLSGKMALEARRMEQDVEDGELSHSDSDSDMPASGSARGPAQKPHDGNSSARPFQSIISPCAPNVPYRTTKGVDSSDESFSDSDDDTSVWKRKRQKCFNLPPAKPQPFQFDQSHQNQMVLGGKKINNIWGAVLQEQNQDAVATELGILGMEGNIDKSRQSETYNYLLAKKLMKETDQAVEILDKELDEYMQDDKKTVSKEEENGQGLLKRKRPVKDRVGERLEMNYKGRYEITEEDSEEKVADEISYRLREPKKDLIARVVKIIGKKKAIELLMETAEVEQNGGLFIMNGSRRRTPGGVYLNLLKNTPSITGEQIKNY
ncbi:phosphorylated adapter RNA export protein isoform X2 [Emydura macquarii macquarii]|uniref:phosphorylated adapter RNA export protein isoform X2 n=1 Tax=Emydura macquarii macquarii TaxID=1129001 RepID=UPI00352B1B7F